MDGLMPGDGHPWEAGFGWETGYWERSRGGMCACFSLQFPLEAAGKLDKEGTVFATGGVPGCWENSPPSLPVPKLSPRRASEKTRLGFRAKRENLTPVEHRVSA